MKDLLKSILTMLMVLLGTYLVSGQTESKVDVKTVSSTEVKCKPANCDPSLCDAMVASGQCTPEQAALCKAKCSETKVASAKLEKPEVKVLNASLSNPELKPESSEDKVKTKDVKQCQKVCDKASKGTKKSIP